MRARDRRGFTLIEMLVVTVLGSVVLLAALQVLITNNRTYTAQEATISGQQSTRMALELLFNELRQVSPAGGDILTMDSDELVVRMMRKFTRVCDTTTVSGTKTLKTVDIGPVDFAANDSVFIFADNNPKDDDDDVWFTAVVTASDPAAGGCPQNGQPARTLSFAGQSGLFTADTVGIGAPVRSFTTVRYALTTYNGDVFLGRAEGSGSLTPVAGPLRAGDGIEFVYRDGLGAVTATPTSVRQIEVTVRSGSGVINSLGKEVSDSINAWVYTRN